MMNTYPSLTASKPPRGRRRLALLLTCLSLGTSFAERTPAATSERLPGPIFDGLGDLHHPITSQGRQAQRYFDQGLTLLFAFNHREAIRSFRSAAHLDPGCAMAHWGVSYAYGPHVNRPMTAEDHAQAWAALRQAAALKDRVNPRERAYIPALEQRYEAVHRDDRAALDRAFATAMRGLVREYPDDLDAQIWWAQLLEGRSSAAYQTATRAAEYAVDNYCGPNKALEAPRLRHLPWLTWARFGRWDDLLALDQPPPRNGWGLLGLERSLRAQGRAELADSVQRQFQAAWQRADVTLDLAWF